MGRIEVNLHSNRDFKIYSCRFELWVEYIEDGEWRILSILRPSTEICTPSPSSPSNINVGKGLPH